MNLGYNKREIIQHHPLAGNRMLAREIITYSTLSENSKRRGASKTNTLDEYRMKLFSLQHLRSNSTFCLKGSFPPRGGSDLPAPDEASETHEYVNRCQTLLIMWREC